jgi:hypothetical protein
LVVEARRGKKMDTGDYGSPGPRRHRVHPASRVQMRYQIPNRSRRREASQTHRARGPLSLETA